jgi:hypothetical protein
LFWKIFFFENMTIISCFSSDNFFFLQKIKIRMFLSKDATCCEDANNVFLRFVSKCKMWSRNAISNFFLLQKVFLWIRSRDHAWSSHRLCFDYSTRVFSKWRTKFNSIFRNDKSLTRRLIKLDESDSSNLTKTIHQIWYERDDFSSNMTNDISSNLMSCISSNLMSASHQIWWAVSHQTWWAHFIKSEERHLIKLWKRKTILLLSDKRSHASIHCMKNLVWQKIIFVRR